MDNRNRDSLSEDQLNKALEWIKTNWQKSDKSCEICSSTQWSIPQDVVTPALFVNGQVAMGNSYPQFMMVCKKCGNTKYFNAILSGVIEIKAAEEANGK